MKLEKYRKLLIAATTLKTTATCLQNDIETFSEHIKIQCAEINNGLKSIQAEITSLTATATSLSAAQVNALQKLQQVLEKRSKELHKSLEKPILSQQKELDKITAAIAEKIEPHLLEPCEFDMPKICGLATETKVIVDAVKQQLGQCMLAVSKCQSSIVALQNQAQQIDLPSFISHTTKQVEEACVELTQINAQLANTPDKVKQYQKEFFPLYSALAKLSLQSNLLGAPEANTANSASCDNGASSAASVVKTRAKLSP